MQGFPQESTREISKITIYLGTPEKEEKKEGPKSLFKSETFSGNLKKIKYKRR